MNHKVLSLFWPEKEDRPEIIEVRNRFFNWIIYPFLIFGFLSIIMAAVQTLQQGRWVFTLIYVSCYLTFVVTALPGHRIPLTVRSLVLILSLLVLSVSVLVRIGLSGIGLELLLLACAGASALLGRKTGPFLVGLGGFAILIIGGAMISGILPIRPEHMLTSLSPLAWGISLMVFCMVGAGLVMLPQMFFTRLKASLVLLEEHAEKLERSNTSMKQTLEAYENAV